MEMLTRINTIRSNYPYCVAVKNDVVIGYTYASKWRERAAYNGTVETSIYVQNGIQHKGVGTALYNKLLEELRERQFHVALASIAIPNPASVSFHEKMSFEKVAHFREVGLKFDRWTDVGFWQLIL